ncbi:hypothetical protein ColTof4_01454 [Colletotrichum tofieldiae]|nr:hypothetical protein ColTof3_08709 [Colletotrichum tofieldiae]GKT69031.1 hypothetical protein ColTof4_01454 [Colletotrichum tofieldiae]GKT96898.1 hypothetical protein Ct61P_14748 [Colletotrichum tofieldiae]
MVLPEDRLITPSAVVPDLNYDDPFQDKAENDIPFLPSSPDRLLSFPVSGTARAHESPPGPVPTAKRPRRQTAGKAPTLADGIVPFHSDLVLEGSSTPPKALSQHSAHLDKAESSIEPRRPENLTVSFASNFIRHVLYWTTPQHEPDVDPVVDFDDLLLVHRINLGDKADFTSIDDGGLRLVINGVPEPRRVAILEAKRAIGRVDDGEAVLSDSMLGQMAGETLAMRLDKGAWGGPRETQATDSLPLHDPLWLELPSVFVVAAFRYFMRFFEFRVTDRYLEQLREHIVLGSQSV